MPSLALKRLSGKGLVKHSPIPLRSYQQLMAASQKQVEELQRAHAEKIREQQLLEERRRNMESQQKEVMFNIHYLRI